MSPSRPNVVLILVDDMGFSDLGIMGSEIRTPNIDALARGGILHIQTPPLLPDARPARLLDCDKVRDRAEDREVPASVAAIASVSRAVRRSAGSMKGRSRLSHFLTG
jgi:hypothetical protein